MEIHARQHWVVDFLGYPVHMDTLVTMWLVMGGFLAFAFFATRKLSIIPNKTQAFLEILVGLLLFYCLQTPLGLLCANAVPRSFHYFLILR